MIPENRVAKRLWGNLVSCIRDPFSRRSLPKNALTLFGQWFNVLSHDATWSPGWCVTHESGHMVGRDRIELDKKDLAELKGNEDRESRLVHGWSDTGLFS